jgi:hypothetical protein
MGRPRKEPAAKQLMFIATESFATKVDGVDQSIVAGTTRVWEGHELLERFPNWFKPIDAHYGVEAATAAPGEVRGE